MHFWKLKSLLQAPPALAELSSSCTLNGVINQSLQQNKSWNMTLRVVVMEGEPSPHLVDRPDMTVVVLLVRKAASAPLLFNSQQQSLKIYFILQQFDFQ